jgi:hypothetical protein
MSSPWGMPIKKTTPDACTEPRLRHVAESVRGIFVSLRYTYRYTGLSVS